MINNQHQKITDDSVLNEIHYQESHDKNYIYNNLNISEKSEKNINSFNYYATILYKHTEEEDLGFWSPYNRRISTGNDSFILFGQVKFKVIEAYSSSEMIDIESKKDHDHILLHVLETKKNKKDEPYEEYLILQRNGFLDLSYDYLDEKGNSYSGCVRCKHEIPDSTRVCERCNHPDEDYVIDINQHTMNKDAEEYVPNNNNPNHSNGYGNAHGNGYINGGYHPMMFNNHSPALTNVMFNGSNIVRLQGELLFIPYGYQSNFAGYLPVFNLGNHIMVNGGYNDGHNNGHNNGHSNHHSTQYTNIQTQKKFDYDRDTPSPTQENKYDTIKDNDYEDTNNGVYTFNESEFPALV